MKITIEMTAEEVDRRIADKPSFLKGPLSKEDLVEVPGSCMNGENAYKEYS